MPTPRMTMREQSALWELWSSHSRSVSPDLTPAANRIAVTRDELAELIVRVRIDEMDERRYGDRDGDHPWNVSFATREGAEDHLENAAELLAFLCRQEGADGTMLGRTRHVQSTMLRHGVSVTVA